MVQFEDDGTDYYDDYETSNCIHCNCDQTGTINDICDAFNGNCLCKNNYAGDKCDRCVSEHDTYPCDGGNEMKVHSMIFLNFLPFKAQFGAFFSPNSFKVVKKLKAVVKL